MESVLQLLTDAPWWYHVLYGTPLAALLWIRVLNRWDRRQDERARRQLLRERARRQIEGGPPRPPQAGQAS